MTTIRPPVFLLGIFLSAAGIQLGYAQGTLQQLLNNGPSDKRINIVALSEGYTSSQLAQFLTDASTTLDRMLTNQPLGEYRNYFNGYAISVASNESGSDHPSRNITRDTYFNSSYGTSGLDRLVTINSTGYARASTLLQQLMPEYDIVIILVNDTEYGGSGGSFLVSSMHTSSAEIATHELGHSFAHLGDEYSDAYPGYPDVEEPNTTRETQRDQIKWREWILGSTDIPTPATNDYATLVGLFEGAHYHATGWYRPKLNCKMRSLNFPFCEVCAETYVRSVYELVRPIESTQPLATSLTLSDTQTVRLTVIPMKPTSHELQVRWFIDGIIHASSPSPTLDISARQLGTGMHSVVARVFDATSYVKTDPLRLLQDSTVWSVSVAPPSGIRSAGTGRPLLSYVLEQNYPNPFNPRTTIAYQLPSRCNAKLTIHDVLGRELAVLVREEQEAGIYNVVWDAHDFSSGVYVYRLQAYPAGTHSPGSVVATKRMILVK